MKRVVRATLANLRREPSHAAELVSQLVLGEEADVLEEAGDWLRVAGLDGYDGWAHGRSLAPARDGLGGGTAGTLLWTRRDGVLLDGRAADATPVCDLVLGVRLAGSSNGGAGSPRSGEVLLPDGTTGWAEGSGWVSEAEVAQRFPARPEAVVATALSLRGVPYLWGGTSSKAFDCSGFVQRVLGAHRVRLPRDAWQQASVGEAVEPGKAGEGLRAGDLLFFVEDGRRVTHVAIALGGAGRLVHCSTGRAGVGVDSLDPGDPLYSPTLAACVAGARRAL